MKSTSNNKKKQNKRKYVTLVKLKSKQMRKYYLLLITLFFVQISFSQEPIEVVTSEKTMSEGPQLAFTVLIPESKSEEIVPIWKNYVNNRKFGERVGNFGTQIGNLFKSSEKKAERDILRTHKKDNELYIRSIEQSDITHHSMDIYARTTDLREGCQFSAFFRYTDSLFVNEASVDQETIESIKTYIRDFGVIAYQKIVDDQIKEAEKAVKEEEKNLKKMESDTKKMEKSIAKEEVDIQKYNTNIYESESDLARLDNSIESQKYSLASLEKKTPEYENGSKTLKSLKQDQSKAYKNITNNKKRIKSAQSDIKSYKNKIYNNEMKEIKQQSVIEEKEAIVDQLIQKKENIR